MFQIGKIYHRQTDLHDKYGGNRQAGCSSCRAFPYIFIFITEKGKKFGYEDGWVSPSEYKLTGEGQIGNMEMIRGNLRIRGHEDNGKELHLFKQANEKADGYYKYIGQFKYHYHKPRRGLDANGNERDMIQFYLTKIN